MTKKKSLLKNILLFILSIFILFFYWLFNGEIYREKFYAFQGVKKEYSWGHLTLNLHNTMQDEINGILIYGNPYGASLSIYGDYSTRCDLELEKFLLKNKNNNLIDIQNQKPDPRDIKVKENRVSFYPGEDIIIKDYETLNASFKVNIICDGETLQTIEEEGVLLKTQYSEKNNSSVDIIMGL